MATASRSPRRRPRILAGHGLNVTVADARFAKPLDGRLAERLARGHDLVVTIEENVLPGGFGSAVLEHLEDAFAEGPAERARVLASASPTATSPTASRRCCGPRSAHRRVGRGAGAGGAALGQPVLG